MSYDLLLKNANIVDGLKNPPYRGNIGIRDGRIVELGKVEGTATRQMDLDGLVAAPGVVDVHTHYDAMVCWDALLESSSEHGTTTVVQGNCGIGVAPCKPEDHELTIQDLVTLEGMSYDALSKGIGWEFETFPEYLGFLRRRGLGINIAPLVPLSPLRRYTMGDAAYERGANQAEREEMTRNLRAAMEAGAIGFGASFAKHQVGYKGRPLASSKADKDELIAYAGVLREFGRGAIQAHVQGQASHISDDEMEFLEMLSNASGGKSITYSGAIYRPDQPEALENMLQRAERIRLRSILPQSPLRPIETEQNFRSPYLLSGGAEAFKQLLNTPPEEQKRIYADPAWRAQAVADLADGGKRRFGEVWKDAVVSYVGHEEMKRYVGRKIREIAAERGRPDFDTMIDLVLEDDLDLRILVGLRNNDLNQLRGHIKDPRLMIGLSDGGAHATQKFESGYPTYMLGHWVRDEKAITLEHAVARMTSEPADFFGLKDRGRLAPGMAADLMIFDLATVGSPKRVDDFRNDLPGGNPRKFASPTGMAYVVVNGQVVIDHNKPTGTLSGRIAEQATSTGATAARA